MDAVIYARRSNLSDSTSVQDQVKECRAVCERNGWPVRAVYRDDGISASRYGNHRPAWETLKAELRQGDILVVWEHSRTNRDLAEYVALRDLCAGLTVPLFYAGKTLDFSDGEDRFTGGLDALLAERESEQIRTRVLRGKRASAAAGRPSTRPPWGYRLVRPGEWEFDPVEAPRVREAVNRLLAGETMYSVMKFIEQTEGYTPSSLTNLSRAVTNPALAGLRVHRGEVFGKGTWEPLITEEQHLRLVQHLKRIKRAHGYTSNPGPEPKYLLTGIAVCGVCGDGLVHKAWKGKRNPSYVCHRGHCCRVAHAMDAAVEKNVFQVVAALAPLADYGDDPGVAEAISKIEELDDTLAEWTQAAIDGEITPAAFAKIEKGLAAQIAALKPKIAPTHLPLPDADDLAAAWPKESMRYRRQIVRALFAITVIPAERRGARTGKLLIERGEWLIELGVRERKVTGNPTLA